MNSSKNIFREELFFAEILLPLPLDQTFTYAIHTDEKKRLKVGARVAIPFGKGNKTYTGIVCGIHQNPPSKYEAKFIEDIIDQTPVVLPAQINFWRWLADYYMCPLGTVFKQAIPRYFLMDSQTVILPTTFDFSDTSDAQYLILEALKQQGELTVKTVQKLLSKKQVFPILQEMLAQKMIVLQTVLTDKYTEKKIECFKIHPDYDSQNGLQNLLEKLQNSHKQREVLMRYFQISNRSDAPIKTSDFLQQTKINRAILKALEKKGYIVFYTVKEDRIQSPQNIPEKINATEDDSFFQSTVQKYLQEKEMVLLQDSAEEQTVQIVLATAEKFIQQEKQVLLLVPQLHLSEDFIVVFQKYFGEKAAVYNAKYSPEQRVELWQNLISSHTKIRIIITTASGLFLPFQNLGLVVVLSESDRFYWQSQKMPRFQARDAALMLAKKHVAKVLLTASCASVESFYNAQKGKYGLVKIAATPQKMPSIELIDLKTAHRKREMKGVFSNHLLDEIVKTLHQKKQVVLFQNRRGYAPVLTCNSCGHTPYCVYCDVSLTYHKKANALKCHYCNYHTVVPKRCDVCNESDFITEGLGTEQVVQALQAFLPDIKIARLDRDTTQSKYGYQKIMANFSSGHTDILVGTQMIAKGLHFENVRLVGVVSIDAFLSVPDFRAHEQTYQLLHQLAVRSKRTAGRVKMLIQTFQPDHQILQQISRYDFSKMYMEQLQQRYDFKYPPYHRVLKFTAKHRDKFLLIEGMNWFATALKNDFPQQILGPIVPNIERIKNKYIQYVIFKILPSQSPKKVKQYLKKRLITFESIGKFKGIETFWEVDF